MNPNIYGITQLGKFGVELFFVISGYLACFSLSQGKSVIKFYKKRIIRIIPLYYLCVLYYFITETFIFCSVPSDPTGLGWLRYLFCLNGIVPSEVYFWSNVGFTWTIPVFLLFYLLAPILVRAAKSTFMSAVILIASIGIAVVVSSKLNGWLSALTYLPCFMFGVFVYNAKKENARIFAIISLQFFVLGMKWCDFSGVISRFAKKTDIFIISALFASILLFSEQLRINKNKSIRAIELLDEHSYVLYLVHGVTFEGIIDKVGINAFSNHALSVVFRLFVAIIVTGALTFVVRRFYEKPFQKILSKALL